MYMDMYMYMYTYTYMAVFMEINCLEDAVFYPILVFECLLIRYKATKPLKFGTHATKPLKFGTHVSMKVNDS